MTRMRLSWYSVITFSALVVILQGTSCNVASAQPDDPNDQIIEELEITTPNRISVGCSKVIIPFAGRVMSRTSIRNKAPLSRATFTVISRDRTVTVEVQVEPDGRFAGTVGVWDEIYYSESRSGRKRKDFRPGHALLEIAAECCESRFVKVNHDWRPRDIVLKCKTPSNRAQSN